MYHIARYIVKMLTSHCYQTSVNKILDNGTVVPTKSDSDVIFCFVKLSIILYTPLEQRESIYHLYFNPIDSKSP